MIEKPLKTIRNTRYSSLSVRYGHCLALFDIAGKSQYIVGKNLIYLHSLRNNPVIVNLQHLIYKPIKNFGKNLQRNILLPVSDVLEFKQYVVNEQTCISYWRF